MAADYLKNDPFERDVEQVTACQLGGMSKLMCSNQACPANLSEGVDVQLHHPRSSPPGLEFGFLSSLKKNLISRRYTHFSQLTTMQTCKFRICFWKKSQLCTEICIFLVCTKKTNLVKI